MRFHHCNMVRVPHDMSHSPQSSAAASPATHSIKISSLLNGSMQSSSASKYSMPPSGLPTPDSTPLQEPLQASSSSSSFQESPSAGIVDPAVLPIESHKEVGRDISLFPDDVSITSNHTDTQHPVLHARVSSRTPSSASLANSPTALRRSSNGRASSRHPRRSESTAIAFQETVPAEVWYQLHAIDKAGDQRPETIAFKSQLWEAAAMAPKEYVDQLSQTVHDLTFASGKAAGLNWLSTVCADQIQIDSKSVKAHARATSKSMSARRAIKFESRQAGQRRPSIKKRTNADGGEPEAKRMRAAAVHKEKPSSYLEVPDYSPALSSFNATNVKAFAPRGGRIDLSNDPHNSLIGSQLNQQEKSFAEVNQLDINKYLINKRKIFQGRLQVYLQGKKSFTKTHAQQAAIIDVNKASRMWEFFEQAGWLDMKHFKKYIADEKENMLSKHMPVAKEFLA